MIDVVFIVVATPPSSFVANVVVVVAVARYDVDAIALLAPTASLVAASVDAFVESDFAFGGCNIYREERQ